MVGGASVTANVYIFTVTHNTIVSYYVHVQYTCVLSLSTLLFFFPNNEQSNYYSACSCIGIR